MNTFRQSLGPAPLSNNNTNMWNKKVETLKGNFASINKMVDKFNLIVPIMNNQKFLINHSEECERIFNNGYDPSVPNSDSNNVNDANTIEKGNSGIISDLFKALFNKS